MTKKIDLKSDIVSPDDTLMYDWFGLDYIQPSDIETALYQGDQNEPVELDIASNGGDVFAASEMYALLNAYPGQVNVFVQGLAASAATIVAMAGDKISIAPTAQMMIHKASTQASGNADDLNHQAGVLNNIDKSIVNAYQLKTGMSPTDLLQLMSNETWLTAQDAVDKGFADEITAPAGKSSAVVQAPLFANSLSNTPSRDIVNKFNLLIGKAKAFDKLQTTEEPLKAVEQTQENKKTDKSELKNMLALLF